MSRSSKLTPATRLQRRHALALATALAFTTTGLFAISSNASSEEPAITVPAHVIAGQLDPDEAVRLERLRARWASQAKIQSDSSPHAGATWTVTSCADDGSVGTLRDILDNHAGDGDTIDISGLDDCTIVLQSSLVTEIDNLTIKGNQNFKYGISGNNQHRVIDHRGTGTLTLDGVPVKGGVVSTNITSTVSGGCILSKGNVALTNQSLAKYCVAENTDNGHALGGAIRAIGNVLVQDSAVRNNKAIANNDKYNALGGAIHAGGQITLDGSSISGNEAKSPSFAKGGAVFSSGPLVVKYSELNGNKATITGTDADQSKAGGGAIWLGSESGNNAIINSTIHGNTAGYGSALVLDHGVYGNSSTLIQQSTIANNKAVGTQAGAAGAIEARHQTTIQNSTISGNTEANDNGDKYGAGIRFSPSAQLTLFSTIVAGNMTLDVGGGAVAYGSDLIGDDINDPDPITVAGENNLVQINLGATPPAGTLSSDPQLQPLADNGGYTLTMALPVDSPAVNTGKANGFMFDQRGPGFVRNWGSGTDIGAFEYQPDIKIFSDNFE